jgi:DNA-binding transcriptional LysR family regulator
MLHKTDLSRADLNLLVLFETVMAERHVRKAAERLNLSPSAVSHGLGRLRALLDDPLFLKTPKGVVPTQRAEQLAGPIAEILARVRNVIASAEPFDPAHSQRRFAIGAPDGVSSVFLPVLLDIIRQAAPGIDLGLRQIFPKQGELSPDRAWGDAIGELETGTMDVAIIPSDQVPARFMTETLFEEDFIVAMRARHPFARNPSLRNYCAMRHLVVSQTGDASGFVDRVLAGRQLSRRVALTVPNFMFALAVLAESDFISALPRHFVALHGRRFGITTVESPIKLPRFRLSMVVPKVAMKDAGLAWLVGILKQSGQALPKQRSR